MNDFLQAHIIEMELHAKAWKAGIMYIQPNNKIFCYKSGDYVERTKEEKDLIVLVIVLIMVGYQFDEAVKNANAIVKQYV